MKKLMVLVAFFASAPNVASATPGSEGARFDWNGRADEHFVEADKCQHSAYAEALAFVREAEARFIAGEVTFDDLRRSGELETAFRYLEVHCGDDKDVFSTQLINGFQGTRNSEACKALVHAAMNDGCYTGAAALGGGNTTTNFLIPQAKIGGAALAAGVGSGVNAYLEGKREWAKPQGDGQPCKPT